MWRVPRINRVQRNIGYDVQRKHITSQLDRLPNSAATVGALSQISRKRSYSLSTRGLNSASRPTLPVGTSDAIGSQFLRVSSPAARCDALRYPHGSPNFRAIPPASPGSATHPRSKHGSLRVRFRFQAVQRRTGHRPRVRCHGATTDTGCCCGPAAKSAYRFAGRTSAAADHGISISRRPLFCTKRHASAGHHAQEIGPMAQQSCGRCATGTATGLWFGGQIGCPASPSRSVLASLRSRFLFRSNR